MGDRVMSWGAERQRWKGAAESGGPIATVEQQQEGGEDSSRHPDPAAGSSLPLDGKVRVMLEEGHSARET
eukprot:scaffold29474_cov131-Isochrysis_galbana.AAC.3